MAGHQWQDLVSNQTNAFAIPPRWPTLAVQAEHRADERVVNCERIGGVRHHDRHETVTYLYHKQCRGMSGVNARRFVYVGKDPGDRNGRNGLGWSRSTIKSLVSIGCASRSAMKADQLLVAYAFCDGARPAPGPTPGIARRASANVGGGAAFPPAFAASHE